MSYILALDQGTTSCRAIAFDRQARTLGVAQQEFEQFFPKPGWVEHDPEEIWQTQREVMADVIAQIGSDAGKIVGIGVTNQRETTVVWNRTTGVPVYNALVWQDRRTASRCDQLAVSAEAETIRQKTGLILDAYFAGTKIQWILEHVDGARELAERGELAFGTIDSWLIWKLTAGKLHVTDPSNASRTLLFNIHTEDWDDELLKLFEIPRSMLPELTASSGICGHVDQRLPAANVPIAGIAGDQQAALFGQLCTETGMVKTTYGTGCFMLMNVGKRPIPSTNRLLSTVAWNRSATTTFVLEGSVFVGGAVVQWLRDGLGLFESSREISELAATVPDNGGVYFVPALAGLGAPHWDPYARGLIIGLTRGTTKAHVARAALEGIAFQVADVLEAMESDFGSKLTEIRVDGGAAANDILMQFQADIIGVPVVRPKNLETTALGAAYLAGLAVGFWQTPGDIVEQWQIDRKFLPGRPAEEVKQLKQSWRRALERSKGWIEASS